MEFRRWSRSQEYQTKNDPYLHEGWKLLHFRICLSVFKDCTNLPVPGTHQKGYPFSIISIAIFQISVEECNCCPPSLIPLTFSTDPSHPRIYTFNEAIHESVLVTLNCPRTSQNAKIWRVYAKSGKALEVALPAATQNDSSLSLASRSLQPGDYVVTLRVSLARKSFLRVWLSISIQVTMDDPEAISNSITGYLSVVPASIVPVIYKNQTRVSIGRGAALVVNPQKDTIDPNIAPGSAPTVSIALGILEGVSECRNFQPYDNFEWTCSALGTSKAAIVAAEDSTVDSWLQNCASGSSELRATRTHGSQAIFGYKCSLGH